MSHGAMLWGAALYNNGSFPLKDAHFGSYDEAGQPQALFSSPAPTPSSKHSKGFSVVPEPDSALGDIAAGQYLRDVRTGRQTVRLRGPEIPIEKKRAANRTRAKCTRPRHRQPYRSGLSGRKDARLAPTLNLLGTNDHAGDYRSSGCTACHVIYANDTSLKAAGHPRNRDSRNPGDTKIPKNDPATR